MKLLPFLILAVIAFADEPKSDEVPQLKAQITFLQTKLSLTEKRCEGLAQFWQYDQALKDLKEPSK